MWCREFEDAQAISIPHTSYALRCELALVLGREAGDPFKPCYRKGQLPEHRKGYGIGNDILV